jgi:hypothetical protein
MRAPWPLRCYAVLGRGAAPTAGGTAQVNHAEVIAVRVRENDEVGVGRVMVPFDGLRPQ